MKIRTMIPSASSIALIAVGVSVLALQRGAQASPPKEEAAVPAPLPERPADSKVTLVSVQPFELEQPYTHWWRAERPSVRAGWIVVLAADPELIRPRQTLEAVLYVGNETAERCNAGAESGHLVALVPSTADPTREPIWFGDPALPEQVDAAGIELQRARAEAAGVRPPGPGSLAPGRRLASFHGFDRADLDLVIADHIERYSPDESDLIDGLRVPVTR